MKKILVPIDFAPSSALACDLARELAAKFGSEIVVLHVWEPMHFVGPEALIHPLDVPVDDDGRHAAEEQLQRFLAQYEEDGGGRLQGRMEIGEACEAILRAAAAENADLIIMGTHGRTGFSRLLLGSVAERVVRLAPCPVLTTKSPRSRAAARQERPRI